ncbi:MAG: ABC-F family ATP-binding cassette domain-containing protein [Endozoicomonas sp.]|uniref:ABC-F family ATP-binding cassette domain-containing protein n=1 Tax=Endozoicomonas sp. TaxID=1892382 RepID=UPI003D9AFCC9
MPAQKHLSPILQVDHLTFQFDNGETLFKDIALSLTARLTGLVGRNGAGKSVLASVLAGTRKATRGGVRLNGQCEFLSQLPSELTQSRQSIARFLEIEEQLLALKKVEQGSSDPQWFEVIGDQWQLEQEVSHLLTDLGLPVNTSLPCHTLSGGQLSRLRLWKLFHSRADLLILDEPSNHLDQEGRQWLLEQMLKFKGFILLISHDRMLLRNMEQILELNSKGLTVFGGHYDFYEEQKALKVAAFERQLENAQKERKQLKRRAQSNQEKADQRAAIGKRLRKSGGLPKIVLDGMKGSAEKSASKRLNAERTREEQSRKKLENLKQQQEQLKIQKLSLKSSDSRSERKVFIQDLVLPYGSDKPLNLVLDKRSRLHLSGANGCGKSTLMKVLLGDVQPFSGELSIHSEFFYLDQHFHLLKPELNLLENMAVFCSSIRELEVRQLLAGIGFRGEAVYRKVENLSGGEKMKLAMLIVSHQPEEPMLLLDEPDNHLDIDSRKMLAEALTVFQGAFILISHDDDFICEAGVNECLTLS